MRLCGFSKTAPAVVRVLEGAFGYYSFRDRLRFIEAPFQKCKVDTPCAAAKGGCIYLFNSF